MKKIICFLAVTFLFSVSLVCAAVVEDWSGVQPGANIGSAQDSNGSKLDFSVGVGAKAGEKALQINSNLVQGGWCSIWHNLTVDLSKAGSLKFQAKSTVSGMVSIALQDAYSMSYVADFQVGPDWTPVTIPFSSFKKNPYYTPPGAVPGHPMDLSKTSGINFQPQMVGATTILIGPIESAVGGANPPSGASAGSKKSGSGKTVVIQDFSSADAGIGGTFQDSQGSAITIALKDKSDNKGKYLSVNYDLKTGGNCGIWYRTGIDWNGIDLSGAQSVNFDIYSKAPVTISLSLSDKNKNQYVADAPGTTGGKWETLSIPIDSFILNPYYTPPEAVKGAPKDFSSVGTFGIQPKTEGANGFGISSIVGK